MIDFPSFLLTLYLHFTLSDDDEEDQGNGTFQILRKILDCKNVSINPTHKQSSNNNNSSQPIAVTNGSQCPHCRRVYADAVAVNRHIKKYCLKEKRFGCIFCHYRSKRKDHIVRHSIRVHDKQLRKKIIDGEFAAPGDAVLKDGKLCEPETTSGMDLDGNFDMSNFDLVALYPEITADDDAINEDDENQPECEILPIKKEPMNDSDDDDD
jgi:hypothetical protein